MRLTRAVALGAALAAITLTVPTSRAAGILWSSAGGSAWLTGTNWTGSSVPGSADIAQFGLNPTGATGVGINYGQTTNNGTRNQIVGAIEILSTRTNNPMIIGNSSGTAGNTGILTLAGVTVNGVNNVVLRNNSNQLLTIQNTQASGTSTLTLALGNTTDNVVNIDSSGGITISTVISGASKNLTFNGSSTGQLTLSGANTFSGTFTANSGTTNLGSATTPNGALGSVTAVSIASGATVVTATTGFTNTINDTAAVTLNGTLDLTGGTETVGSLAGTNTGASLKIGKFTTTEGSFTVGDANNTNFAGVISGSRVTAGGTIFTKQGTGILTLSGTNTYTDITAITAGGITITNSAGLGATGANNGTTVSTGAVLALDGTAGNLTVGNELLTLNGAGLTASPAGALRNIAGTNSYAGAITTATASTITSSAGTLTLTGGITNNGNRVTFDGAGNTNVSTNKITGTGGLTKTGNGTLTLSVANDYTGSTIISGGTLSAAVGTLVSTASTTVNNGGTLLLSGNGRHLGANADVFMNGGTFNTGGFAEPTTTHDALPASYIGPMTLQQSSILNLATGTSIIAFTNSSSKTWTGTLSIYNWSGNLVTGNGTDQVYFGTDITGLTLGQLGQISFYSDSGTTFLGNAAWGTDLDGEIVPLTPVPEPGTWVGAALALGAIGFTQRRRFWTAFFAASFARRSFR